MISLRETHLSARAYLACALALLRDVCPRGDAAPPTASHLALSPTWLAPRLAETGVSGADIAEIEIAGLAENRGLVASMSKVLVTLRNGDKVHLVLKTSGTSLKSRREFIAYGRARETAFYNELARELPAGIQCPEVVYAHGSMWLGEYTILMVDLTADGDAVGINLLLGNQAWGLPDGFTPRDDDERLDVLGKAWTSAAALHGAFWMDESVMAKGFLKGVDWLQGSGRASWENYQSISIDGWASFLNKYDATTAEFKMDARFERLVSEGLRANTWENLQRRLKARPFTMCHGDFHASNMIMTNGKPVVFDWSEVGPSRPAGDAAQMAISDLPARLFPKIKDLLRKTYWEPLVAHERVGDSYSFEECWNDFCLDGLQRWIWVYGILADMQLPAHAMQYHQEQMLAFLALPGNDERKYFADVV